MFVVSTALRLEYEKKLFDSKIAKSAHHRYHKWLRHYLDFFQKYKHTPGNKANLPKFLCKLQEQKQTRQQQAEANHAMQIYYRLLNESPSRNS